MSMAGARFFQFYLDNYFKFPKEIKNDIIYCQRAFHAHLKVHQLVVTKIKPNDSLFPHKDKILHEIEDEMILINGEQNYLLLRLRRVIDEFYKTVQRGGIPIDQELTNQLIFKEVGPHIHDTRTEILPVSVAYHNTEEKLMDKYFHAKTFTPNEIIDITDDDIVIVEKKVTPAEIKVESLAPIPPPPPQPMQGSLNGQHAVRNANSINHLSQVSLLKPISQRMVSNLKHNIGARSLYPEQPVVASSRGAQYSTSSTYGRVTPYEVARNSAGTAAAVTIKEEPSISLPVSKNVTLSRLNLQQALKKAKTETLAAKASANNILLKPAAGVKVNAPAPLATSSLPSTIPTNAVVVKPKLEPRTKSSLKSSLRSALTGNPIGRPPKHRAVSTSPSSSSSEEYSNPEREPSPTQAYLLPEEEPQLTQPEDYGQEMFLRIFGLVTPEMHVQMQQRRSKRKRRTVQSKERADFHYGRIEYTMQPTDEKNNKKKAFLLSPQVKRNKKRKCASLEKINDLPLSRSGSSSPDEKRVCNECLKRGGAIDQCKECKGYFHQSCHPAESAETKLTSIATKRPLTVEHKKFCPACNRMQMNLIKKEAKQYETLNSTVHELKQKLAQEKHRRASLQQTSKIYKTQMRNLFNIVNTIKSDNDSSD